VNFTATDIAAFNAINPSYVVHPQDPPIPATTVSGSLTMLADTVQNTRELVAINLVIDGYAYDIVVDDLVVRTLNINANTGAVSSFAVHKNPLGIQTGVNDFDLSVPVLNGELVNGWFMYTAPFPDGGPWSSPLVYAAPASHLINNPEELSTLPQLTGQVVSTLVPEPASVGLLALGGVVLLRRQRRSS